MNAKYANVTPMDQVIAQIDGLPDGLFDNLPSGKAR
jgi:hypothetical protein